MRQFCICIHHKVQKGWATLGWYRSYLTFEWWLLSCIITVVKKEQIAAIFPNDPLPYTTKWEWSKKKTISGQNDQNLVLVNTVRSYFMCWCVQVLRLLRWSIDLLEVGRGATAEYCDQSFICRQFVGNALYTLSNVQHSHHTSGLRMNYYLGRAKGRFDSLTVSQKCHRLLFALFVWNFLKIICNFPFALKRLFQWR